jgi:hypothetical protein
MKKSSQSPRTPSSLSDTVHHQLNMYVLAAGAAGVGILASAQPVDAKVVYTPAHTKIAFCDPTRQYPLNLNHDADIDFLLSTNRFDSTLAGTSLGIHGAAPANQVAGDPVATSAVSAWALQAGDRVGPDLLFGRFAGMATRLLSSERVWCYGFWANVTKHYLGLRFQDLHQRLHYGWARLNVSCRESTGWGGLSGLLTGYAYETIPNKAIIAGKTEVPDVITLEPGSLGALAAGHRGKSH